MVLVGALSLADGLADGVGSVADRIGSGPAVYLRGTELLASEIDPGVLAGVPGDFLAMRVHPAELEINGLSVDVVVVALAAYHDGNGTTAFPVGRDDLSIDVGLEARIEAESGTGLAASGNLSRTGQKRKRKPPGNAGCRAAETPCRTRRRSCGN